MGEQFFANNINNALSIKLVVVVDLFIASSPGEVGAKDEEIANPYSRPSSSFLIPISLNYRNSSCMVRVDNKHVSQHTCFICFSIDLNTRRPLSTTVERLDCQIVTCVRR